MKEKQVNIIGAGLAGVEAAYQLLKRGYEVTLFEGKTKRKNDLQKIETFAELVCSNTFRSTSTRNAAGMLKKEMEMFDSIVMKVANQTRVEADDALAVDRILFSKQITAEIRKFEHLKVVEKDINVLDLKQPTIIASGPMTTPELTGEIQKYFGKSNLFFLDASSAIVEKKSLDTTKFYQSSRHKNDQSYLCYPLTELEFENFYQELISAKTVELHDIDKEIYFKGCQPIEIMAKESRKLLLNGPMSPNNLENIDGNVPYAVIQLRKDDANDQFYNLVGFQTNISWPEQKRLFQTLSGWENVNIVRYGVLHKNNYLNSPKILNHFLQSTAYNNLFFAGQITGVEGYLESAASGIVAAIGAIAYLEERKFRVFPNETVLGSLINYVTNKNHKHLKPMKANIGLLPVIEGNFDSRDKKNDAIFERDIKSLQEYIKKNKI